MIWFVVPNSAQSAVPAGTISPVPDGTFISAKKPMIATASREATWRFPRIGTLMLSEISSML